MVWQADLPRLSESVFGEVAVSAWAAAVLAAWPAVLGEVTASAWAAPAAVLATWPAWWRRSVRSGLPEGEIEPTQPVRVSVSIRAGMARRGQWVPGAERPMVARRRPARWAPGWKSPWRAPPVPGRVAATPLRSAGAWNSGVPTNRPERRTAGRGADRKPAATPAATGR